MLPRVQGPTNRRKALTTEPNSFRSNYGLSDTRNAVHGSDSVDQVCETTTNLAILVVLTTYFDYQGES